MKIVISGYVGKKITGIGRNLISLLENSSSKNKYIIYTNMDMAESFANINKNVIVKTYNISKNSSIGNLLWTTFVFPFMVLREKADIALIPNFTLLLIKFRTTVVIMHDLIEFNVPDKFSKLKMFYRTRLADPITAWMADKIITDSNNSKKDIVKFLGVDESKISIVYCGVDREKFRRVGLNICERIFAEKNWPHKFILYAGTIDHPGKNVMSVVKAYEALRKNGEYNGGLILAGMPGSGYEIVENHIQQSDYRNEIFLTGYVTDEELVSLYSSCDVFCFLSLYEGFGIPPLEALSCGAPVIVSNTSSLPEVVGDVGEKVDPMNQSEICSTMKKLLSDENYFDDNSDRIYKHLDNYNWSNLSIKFENILSGISGR